MRIDCCIFIIALLLEIVLEILNLHTHALVFLSLSPDALCDCYLIQKCWLSRAAVLFEDAVQEELTTSYLFVRDIHTDYFRMPYACTPAFSLEIHSALLAKRELQDLQFSFYELGPSLIPRVMLLNSFLTFGRKKGMLKPVH